MSNPFIIIPSIILRAQITKAGSQGYFRSDWSALTEMSKSRLLIGQAVRARMFFRRAELSSMRRFTRSIIHSLLSQ